MHANVPSYHAFSPQNLKQALEILEKSSGTVKPLAGGTDLMVMFNADRLPFHEIINLNALRQLRGLRISKNFVTIGSLETFSQIQNHKLLIKEFPNLVAAAKMVGSIAIQNRATIGGNIMNASPAGDSLPALMSYDAEIQITSYSRGSRWVPFKDFYTGYKTTLCQPHELLTQIRLPRTFRGAQHYFEKVGTRNAQAISKVVCAGVYKHDRTGKLQIVRVSFGSLGPHVVRCLETEKILLANHHPSDVMPLVTKTMLNELKAIDDIRSNAHYRMTVAQNLVQKMFGQWKHVELDRKNS